MIRRYIISEEQRNITKWDGDNVPGANGVSISIGRSVWTQEVNGGVSDQGSSDHRNGRDQDIGSTKIEDRVPHFD